MDIFDIRSLAMSVDLDKSVASRSCEVCMVLKNPLELSNIMEAGPNKDDWSGHVYHFYGIELDKSKPDGNLSMICWSCLKRIIEWTKLKKDILVKQMIKKYFYTEKQQGYKPADGDLSLFCAELNNKLSDVEMMNELALQPIAESCMKRIAELSSKPIAGPSIEPIAAGPSIEPIAAGPSWAPTAGPSIEPIAEGPSWAPTAEPSIEPIAAGPSWAPVAGPSWASVAGPSWAPVAGPSWAPVAGPSVEPIIAKSLTKNTSVIQIKNKCKNIKSTCPFCNSNYINCQKFTINSTMKLCGRHMQPYTCLFKDCYLVFPNKDVFIPHYRTHMNLKKHTYLCRRCLAILGSSRNVKRDTHKHQDTSKLYNCCFEKFPTMVDFVLHKLMNHSSAVTVIMAIHQLKDLIFRPIHPVKPSIDLVDITNKTVLTKPEITTTTNSVYQDNCLELFTCLVPCCNRVYDVRNNNIEHFKKHAEILPSYFLCNICLVYSFTDCPNLKCEHINPLILCGICNTSFTTVSDLAKHKIFFHASIILCGLNNTPGCSICGITFKRTNDKSIHYKQCFDDLNNLTMKFNNEDNKSYDNKIGIINNSPKNGSIICKVCGGNFFTTHHYVKHVKRHGHTYNLKDPDLCLCPVCDKNYPKLEYSTHIELCTNTMEIAKGAYGCIFCRTKITVTKSFKYRIHFVFCKSFDTLKDDNGKTYYKCLNCTFVHYKLVSSLMHAAGQCIFFQMRVKYSASPYETQEVYNRNLKLTEIEKFDLKPFEVNENFNPGKCNRNRQKLLGEYAYLCNLCGKKFFSEIIFKRHLNNFNSCRPPHVEYCKICVADFINIELFTLHLKSIEMDKIIDPSVHKPLKCEEIDFAMSTVDDVIPSNELIPSCSYDVNSNEQISSCSYEVKSRELTPSYSYEVNSRELTPSCSYDVNSNEPISSCSYEVKSRELTPSYSYEVNSRELTPSCSYEVKCRELTPSYSYEVNSREPIPSCSYDVNSREPIPSCSYDVNSREPIPSCSYDVNNREPIPSCSYDVNNHEPIPSCSYDVNNREPIPSCSYDVNNHEPIPSCSYNVNVRTQIPSASNVTSCLPFISSDSSTDEEDYGDDISFIGSDDLAVNDEYIILEDEKPDLRDLN